MTSTPEEPQSTPEQSGATPPPPPAPGTPPPPPAGGATPPPPAAGGYGTPPPVGGYQAPPPAGGYGAAGQAPLSDSDQRMWAMLAHLGGLIFSFIAPLVIWLVFRERGRYVDEQGKEALNFQITLAIISVAIWIIGIITLGIGFILYLAFIVALVFMIMAAVAVNKGEPYRYPVNIRLVK